MRVGRDVVTPRGDRTGGIECRREFGIKKRAMRAEAELVFAGPLHHDGPLGGSRQPCRFECRVGDVAAAIHAAHHLGVHVHTIRYQAEELGNLVADTEGPMRRDVEVRLGVSHIRDRGTWADRAVCDVRHMVVGTKRRCARQTCVDAVVVPKDEMRAGRHRFDGGRPFSADGRARRRRLVASSSDDREHVVAVEDVDDSMAFAGFAVVEAKKPRATNGRMYHMAMQHAGQAYIGRITRAARDDIHCFHSKGSILRHGRAVHSGVPVGRHYAAAVGRGACGGCRRAQRLAIGRH